jgi:MFS family permease
MIPLPVMVESRFLRSTAAAFGQMFCLGTVLVALPLLFTGPLGMSTAVAGALFFMLPGVMAVGAPASSWLSRRFGPRRILRSGLLTVVVGTTATGLIAAAGSSTGVAVALCAMLVVLGLGMALVQTPAAAGATSSPAGQYGAAVGLFSMIRFSGSGTAAAWVALVYPTGSMPLLFGGCALVALLGLAASYAGPDPVTPMVAPLTRSSGRG